MQYFQRRFMAAATGAAILLGAAGLLPHVTLANLGSGTETFQQHQGGYGYPYNGYGSSWSGYTYPSHNWLAATGNSYPGSGLSAWSSSGYPYAGGASWSGFSYPSSTYYFPGLFSGSYGYSSYPTSWYSGSGHGSPSSANWGYGSSYYDTSGYYTSPGGTSYFTPAPCYMAYYGAAC